MTTTFTRESIFNLWQEVEPLLHEHYLEIARYPDIPLSVDHKTYEQAEEANILRCYIARKDTVLIGYAAFFIRYNPHYQESLQAVQDVVFISKPYRRGRVGMNLLQFAEAQLKQEGVQVIMHHAKKGHPELARLLQYMGYEEMETLYAKRTD